MTAFEITLLRRIAAFIASLGAALMAGGPLPRRCWPALAASTEADPAYSASAMDPCSRTAPGTLRGNRPMAAEGCQFLLGARQTSVRGPDQPFADPPTPSTTERVVRALRRLCQFTSVGAGRPISAGSNTVGGDLPEALLAPGVGSGEGGPAVRRQGRGALDARPPDRLLVRAGGTGTSARPPQLSSWPNPPGPHYMDAWIRSCRSWIRLARGDTEAALADQRESLISARQAKDPQALFRRWLPPLAYSPSPGR